MARRQKEVDNRKDTQNNYSRKKDVKNKILSVIIACEDESSAPTYFKMIVKNLKENKIITQDSLVIANHKHNTPKGVLDDLIKHKEDGKNYKNFEHKWIVIDRDAPRANGGGHTKDDFNGALSSAKAKDIKVAYANDSYELWYLLHFNYRPTAITRDKILEQVIKKLKEKNFIKFKDLDKENIKSQKYSELIFDELLGFQSEAIKNAKNLLESYGQTHNPERDNPSTTIHILVEILNNLKN
ncbi:RloB family protein [Aliarcobacter butzleri]|uniref:RloB family protein n=1 Tax=Aliarcobacter butzleri TaxID=28197 RepID=UPI00125F4035|nr:RloB family protein [Aliarcobacter butzleri]MCG3692718.1 RloB family protein [Aliarcobacter butzleri]MDN5098357.1 RloB family protein [Aliarcobacter butzleri]